MNDIAERDFTRQSEYSMVANASLKISNSKRCFIHFPATDFASSFCQCLAYTHGYIWMNVCIFVSAVRLFNGINREKILVTFCMPQCDVFKVSQLKFN